MGPLFVWIVTMLLLVPVGLALGSLVAFVGVPLYYRIRKTPLEGQRIRGWFKVLLMLMSMVTLQVLVSIVMAVGFAQEVIVSDNFYKSQGLSDWWRIPLDYPYEIGMTDITDCGGIYKTSKNGSPNDPMALEFPDVDPELEFVSQYYKQGPQVVGFMYSSRLRELDVQTAPADTQWFSFDCSRGKSIIYISHEQYLQDLPRIGIKGEPLLVPVAKQYSTYWAEH